MTMAERSPRQNVSQPCVPAHVEETEMGKGLLLWLIGVPIPIILLLWLIFG
jgi:hypothetical protein